MTNSSPNAYDDPYSHHQVAPPALPAHQYLSPSPTPTVNNDIEKKDKKHDDMEMGGLADTATKEKKRRMENRNCCLRCLGCACCLPAWAAGIIWFIVIAIIIVIIVIGSIAGTFVMPSVDLVDVTTTNSSQITFAGDSLDINFGLVVSINNPNLLAIQLSDMNAIAYYPNPESGIHSQIGTGYLDYQYVPKYSNFNFTFPFSIQYNPSIDFDQSMLNDIVSKCGLNGDDKQPITVDYTIKLAAEVLSIKIHTSISSTATFDCPIDSGTLSGLDDSGTLSSFL